MNTIAIIGAGRMGAGIAQLAASHGCTVHLIDVSRDVVDVAVARIADRLDRLVENGTTTSGEREALLERIIPGDAIRGLEAVELAIEAVVEDLNVKREVFVQLERAVPESTLLATNTSSLSITQIAEAVRTPTRVLGMHFFNPAPVMPLVEIVAGSETDESTIELAFKAARRWGKVGVLVKDTPGFIVNRVARGYYLEAVRLLGEGVAGVDEIDAVMRMHGKFPMGPFELMDMIGLDVNLTATTSVWERLGKPTRLAPHGIQSKLVEQGHCGRKSGRGFYLYDGDVMMPASVVDRLSYELTPLLAECSRAFTVKAGGGMASSTERYIFGRVLGAVINEAGLAFAEEVAGGKDIDIAMVEGMSFPKGPLAWADDIGHRAVFDLLKMLNEAVADNRYEPAPLFARRG